MAALKFEMEDIADHEVTEKTFYVLRDFLQPNAASTLESTARTLLDLLPAEKTVGSDELMFFNNVCIDFAGQIPYWHPLQHQLAALVEYLAGSAKLNVSHPTSYGGERMHWMGAELRGAWAAPDRDNPMAYVNMWAFTANLYERRIFRTDPHRAIICLSEALEGARPGAGDIWTTRDIQVLSAAQWILWYGQSLFKQVLTPIEKFYPNTPEYDDTGPLYYGKRGLSLDRWRFWRNGFNAVASSGKEEKQEYSRECRDVAGKAADMMEVFENSMASRGF